MIIRETNRTAVSSAHALKLSNVNTFNFNRELIRFSRYSRTVHDNVINIIIV